MEDGKKKESNNRQADPQERKRSRLPTAQHPARNNHQPFPPSSTIVEQENILYTPSKYTVPIDWLAGQNY